MEKKLPLFVQQDIELALGSGYPKGSAYKLHIRQCKCLLELGRIVEAQKAFDQALDAIDRSGLNKGLRKDLAVDLQVQYTSLKRHDPLKCGRHKSSLGCLHKSGQMRDGG